MHKKWTPAASIPTKWTNFLYTDLRLLLVISAAAGWTRLNHDRWLIFQKSKQNAKKAAIFGWQYSPTSAAAEIASISPSPSFNKIEWRQCLTMLRCNCVSVKWLTSVSICCCWKVVWSMCEQIRVIHFPQQRRFVLSFSFSTFNAFRASLFACFACFTSISQIRILF